MALHMGYMTSHGQGQRVLRSEVLILDNISNKVQVQMPWSWFLDVSGYQGQWPWFPLETGHQVKPIVSLHIADARKGKVQHD